MSSRKNKAHTIQRRIREVLLRHWDPIGVRDAPGAQDEYDAYVGGVYRLLASGASAKEIATHPVNIEAEQLGFKDTDPRMLIPLANRLKRLNIRLSSESGAT